MHVVAAGTGNGKLSIIRIARGLGLRRATDVVRAVCSGERRSIAEDARRVIALMNPQPRVEGLSLVPRRDPFVLVGNHYEAPGLWVGWVAAAITNAVAEARAPECREMCWLVHPEWRWFEAWGQWVPNPLTSLLFPRAIPVWGMIPTPARPSDVSGRARALRQILTHLRPRSKAGISAPEPIGLFPEGSATFALQEARPGTGAFLHRICRLGVPLLPVGTYQEGPVLVVKFGDSFFVGDPPPVAREDLDGWVRSRMMMKIGRLLPERLWGVYAPAIAGAE